MARRLVQAAGEDRGKLPQLDSLISSIRRWERGSNGITERYLLLYCAALGIPPDQFGLERPGEHSAPKADNDHPPAAGGTTNQAPPLAELTTAPLSEALSRECRTDLARSHPDPVTEFAALASGDSLLRTVEQAALGHPRTPRGAADQERDWAARITQIQAVTDLFRRWDNEFGGGMRRLAVIGQLSDVAGLLDGGFQDERSGRALRVTAADLSQLVGWMSFDSQLPATAQRYYLLGLRMARDAGQHAEVARLLYCLSRLMLDVGEHPAALDLAQVGLYAIRHGASPKALALLRLAEARAHACMGQAADCRHALTAARDAFSLAESGADPAWAGFFDETELAGLTGAALRDLALADAEHAGDHAAAAEPWIAQAVSGRPRAYLRSKILDLDGLAITKLLLGQPDAAAELAAASHALAREVTSARVTSRLRRTLQLARHMFPGFTGFPDLPDRPQKMARSEPAPEASAAASALTGQAEARRQMRP